MNKQVNLKDQIQHNLQDYVVLVKQLLDSLGTTTKENPQPENVMLKMIEKDQDLQNNVKELVEHQKFQRQLSLAEKQEKTLDQQIWFLASQIREAELSLQSIIDSTQTLRESLKRKAVPYSQVVSYAHKVSYTTSAPIGFQTGQQLISFIPPAPLEQDMQKGVLYNKMPKDIAEYFGMKSDSEDVEIPTVAKEEEIEWEEALPTTQPNTSNNSSNIKNNNNSNTNINNNTNTTNNNTNFSNIPIQLPPGLSVPPIPKGWKPGMPILPTGISVPPIPKGWKPGMPIIATANTTQTQTQTTTTQNTIPLQNIEVITDNNDTNNIINSVNNNVNNNNNISNVNNLSNMITGISIDLDLNDEENEENDDITWE